MSVNRVAALIGAGFVSLLLLAGILSSFYTVDQGERGVVLYNGAVGEEAEPGLHFKMPFITTVKFISVQTQKIAFDKHDKETDYSMQAYSRDQQPATVMVVVNYHITNVSSVYSAYGTLVNLEATFLDPKILEQVKNAFGQFDAVNAIQDRAELNAKVDQAVKKATHSSLVVVDSVQIEDITFSNKYEAAVEARMEATVHQQQALADKAKRITEADAAAYEVKAAADARAHQTEVMGQAEAGAIKARGDALRANPDLVNLTLAEKWNGKTPETVLPGSAAPFINLPK